MFTMRNYVQATTIEEAYEYRKKNKNNIVLGGNLWTKMGKQNVMTGIDLCKLGYDKIEEDETSYKIGCMCSLHDLEIHPSLHTTFDGSFKEALRHIVGVQFRNTATVGGSVYPRFGFSDVLTMFAALNTEVVLHGKGNVPIKEFIDSKEYQDILTHVIVQKDGRKVAYESLRHTETDFAILTCALSCKDGKYTVVLGATPYKAKIVDNVPLLDATNEKEVETFIAEVVKQVRFDTNMRGSKEYREAMASVLIKRCLKQVTK